jgi:hypothetical protein
MRSDSEIANHYRQSARVGISVLKDKLCVLALVKSSTMAIPVCGHNSLAPGCGPGHEQFSGKNRQELSSGDDR